ncbi:histidine kinase dimerization/phosphoacceptor domain -containing protein [Rhizobium sp. BK251]|uniref:histidine kinase dimerization/phosphoacceptor domain -containing protein n=1 Tax=Rhizobium sp. BK251 TaxID=2512125 RepID=UPI0010D12FEE|nr:histidine kinase dimerization/phosphoacceptor domain -containing protein [Rhizobium sp. BK251]TCL67142.1 light-regulated signal transduction histidine kinase (bacteriophytochrome) [Rhizobium sp. BK251]
MKAQDIDLTVCDREPIHVPGSIQPHGILLVVDPASGRVTHGAGEIGKRLGLGDWIGRPLGVVLGEEAAAAIEGASPGVLRQVTPPASSETFDLAYHMSGKRLLVELEPAGSMAFSVALLPQIESAAAAFERATDLRELCDAAAREFRRLSGYDRVMVYRFLESDAGMVVAEDTAPGQHSFLNHHFPASDIPKQARALYVRNLVRVIPDVSYEPAPLQPAWTEDEPLDMSDCGLRSVSPVHVQYLKNMGVAASASVSIVKDGALWGLIACHNSTPRPIAADVRAACRALAGGLSRQIKAREETDAYRERVRLRTFEDRIVELLLREGSLDAAIFNHLDEIMQMLDADGVAVLRGSEVVRGGKSPSEAEVRKLAAWVARTSSLPLFSTNSLSAQYQLPEAERPLAAGLLAITLSASEPWLVLWFRAEETEVVNWAGNPHKHVVPGEGGTLNPRASFEAWTEIVEGRARRWTIPEVEAAGHLRVAVTNVWQTRRIIDLNRQLLSTVEQKESLLQQKEFLIGEINHRVQNSLQLVSSFLKLQARESDDTSLQNAIDEACRRIAAVSLVHRRLYSSDQLEAIDAARYVDELLDDLAASFGADWAAHLVRDLQPIVLPNDRAIGLGLVLTELVINANKYAYGGKAGRLRVTLSEDRNRFRLIVADEGVGRGSARTGFGSRLINGLVGQLGGTLEYQDNQPGTRVVLSAPIEPVSR